MNPVAKNRKYFSNINAYDYRRSVSILEYNFLQQITKPAPR